MKSGRLAPAGKCHVKRLTFRVISFRAKSNFNVVRHANLFPDPWEAEVNGFAMYHGKAQQKNNILTGMVGHRIVVLRSVYPFQDFWTCNCYSYFVQRMEPFRKTLIYFPFLILLSHARCSIVNGLFLAFDHGKSRESFQTHSCTSHWQ